MCVYAHAFIHIPCGTDANVERLRKLGTQYLPRIEAGESAQK